jgi:hypothetical protein
MWLAKEAICMTKEAYLYDKRGLFVWQKRPNCYLYDKRGLSVWQKRPTRIRVYTPPRHVAMAKKKKKLVVAKETCVYGKREITLAKETYLYGKRDLCVRQKRAYTGKRDLFAWQKRPSITRATGAVTENTFCSKRTHSRPSITHASDAVTVSPSTSTSCCQVLFSF